MSKSVSTLDVFHSLSTIIAQFKGFARVVKINVSDLELMRDALSLEIDENKSLQEQLKKEREAHKKERDRLVALLAAPQKPYKSKPITSDDISNKAYKALEKRVAESTKPTMDAWQKQVGGSHYKQYAIQPAQFALANKLDYAQSNAIKYIVRHAEKNGVQDLDKAIHYIELLKQHHYNK